MINLIDGDIFAYVCSSAVQKDIDWGDGLWTTHAFLDDAVSYFNQLLGTVKTSLGVTLSSKYGLTINDTIFCFSGQKNFRKYLNNQYKANRVSKRKPTCYQGLKQYILDNFKCQSHEYFEGDDVISSIATSGLKDSCIITSADKDFKTVPNCYFYNYKADTLNHYDSGTAYRNLMIQVLTGDTADNYRGCPSIGKSRAERLVQDCTNIHTLWDTVVKTYEKNKSSKEEAIMNFTMAYLLHGYDIESKRDILKTTPDTSYEGFCKYPKDTL